MGKGLTAVKKEFPKRRPGTHKGDYGRVLIVAGSRGMTGAAVLASRGALRSGAGLVYLAVPKELVNFVDMMTAEVIALPFEEIKNIKPDAVAIGPGLGKNLNLIDNLLHSLVIRRLSLVIDADAINAIAKKPQVLRGAAAGMILTPHPGEMARLLGKTIEDIQKNREMIASAAAKSFGSIVVLKGHRTVVADKSGKIYVDRTGNPGMATAGVGDVLTGMIAGFAAQGFSPWDAAVAGVYLHGLAGDLAAKEKGEYGMIASDLVEKIPYAIRKVY